MADGKPTHLNYAKYIPNRIQRYRFVRHLANSVRYSVVPINSPLLIITLHSSVITTLVYYDTTYPGPCMTLQPSSIVRNSGSYKLHFTIH
jgi:hypothetical protein